jgi:hypothetical protein
VAAPLEADYFTVTLELGAGAPLVVVLTTTCMLGSEASTRVTLWPGATTRPLAPQQSGAQASQAKITLENDN